MLKDDVEAAFERQPTVQLSCSDCVRFERCEFSLSGVNDKPAVETDMASYEDVYRLKADSKSSIEVPIADVEEVEIIADMELVRMFMTKCLRANKYTFFDIGDKPAEEIHADRILNGREDDPLQIHTVACWQAEEADPAITNAMRQMGNL